MGQAPDDATREPINLMRGWPNPHLLPVDLIKRAANEALSNPTVAADGLLYGPDPGYEPLRHAIAEWLTPFYGPPVTASRTCITGGASQNLGSLCSVFTDPEYTRNIWIVAPAYMLAFRVFEDAGFSGQMRAVPEDDDGVDLNYLRRELKKSEEEARRKGVDKPRYKPERKRAKVYKHIIYCVPTFANPSSRTMSRDHRFGIVRLAREFDALIVADDVYDLLQWPSNHEEASWYETQHCAHLPRLVDIDRDMDGGPDRHGADGFGNACSNGSFSKIAGPGMRVGWVEGTEKFAYGVSQTGTTASGGAPSQLTSTYITTLLTSGQLQKHIKDILQPSYASRYSTLMSAVETHLLPLGFSLPQTDRKVVGGYFVWLALPSTVSANALARRCMDEGVIVAAGPIFEVPGDESIEFDGHIRLCFAWEEEANLENGVRRIADAVRGLGVENEGAREGYVIVSRERNAEASLDSFK